MGHPPMKVLVTGSNGFLGRNLCLRLRELPEFEVVTFARGNAVTTLADLVERADAVVHLAGVNRPIDVVDFDAHNRALTERLCNALIDCHRPIPVIFSSSAQAELDNLYGRSKAAAETALSAYASSGSAAVRVYRLPGLFGKWSRPNYNSVVATFCNNIANGLPIQVNDPSKQVLLVYVDDVVAEFVRALNSWRTGFDVSTNAAGLVMAHVEPQYSISLGELASTVTAFRESRETGVIDRVGVGLTRALYSTYVSYLPTNQFSYPVVAHTDVRGEFVEMLKTQDSGQFSYFTAHPGVTRGGHYHHTKTEKFLVIRGEAQFKFRHMVTGEMYELATRGGTPLVVETIPGWTHDITNVGNTELIVMLWANEIFDRTHPDTIYAAL